MAWCRRLSQRCVRARRTSVLPRTLRRPATTTAATRSRSQGKFKDAIAAYEETLRARPARRRRRVQQGAARKAADATTIRRQRQSAIAAQPRSVPVADSRTHRIPAAIRTTTRRIATTRRAGEQTPQTREDRKPSRDKSQPPAGQNRKPHNATSRPTNCATNSATRSNNGCGAFRTIRPACCGASSSTKPINGCATACPTRAIRSGSGEPRRRLWSLMLIAPVARLGAARRQRRRDDRSRRPTRSG